MRKSYDVPVAHLCTGLHIIGAGLKWYTIETLSFGSSKVHIKGVNCFGEEVRQSLPYSYIVTVVKD